MTDSKPSRPENLGSHGAERGKKSPHGEEAVDLGLKSNATSVLEGVEGAEGAEGVDGKIAELAHEGVGEHRQSTAGKFQQFQTQMTAAQAEALKKKLLEMPPPRKQMIREIQKHIHREIKVLQKNAAKCEKQGKFKELNELVRCMRELTDLLNRLIHATADVVKNLWLKVVHGIAA